MRSPEFPDERSLVPYAASTFSGKRVLVLAPHPDDEVFGCGGALADLLEHGASVDVVLVTDGAAEARNEEERGRIASQRIAESRRALEALGGGTVHAGGIPDRGAGDRLLEIETLLGRWLIEATPDLVFCPSPVETHPDHRAVAVALFRLAARPASDAAVRILDAATVAFFELSQPFRPNFLVDITRVLARKERAMDAFASQAAARDYAAFVTGLGAYRRMTLSANVLAVEAYSVVGGFQLRSDPGGVVEGLLPVVPAVTGG
ncbi:MAG TPA: PIG-L deacetylase family protein [Thermoanaerobaculia bacterium]